MDYDLEAPKYIGAFCYVNWAVRPRLNCPGHVIQEIVVKKIEKRGELKEVSGLMRRI